MAPFDRILVTAAAPKAAASRCCEQLALGGKLLVPEGDESRQRLVLYTPYRASTGGGSEGEEVAFVPLVGRHGWQAE